MAPEAQSALHTKAALAGSEPASVQKRGTKRRPDHSPERLIEGIRRGDPCLLAKAITLLESSRPEDQKIADQIVDKCQPGSARSIRVGITGAPGVGKSTLIDAIGKYLITERGEKVAVLAIDPSSELSGGSILGDKVRMPFLSASEMAFVRPSPSRGMRGGVTCHTREAVLLCEAAGYRNTLIETVGVGQSEAAARDIVDFFVLVTILGASDELQGIKRGVMERVDLVAVNKSDGDLCSAGERARAEADCALHLLPATASGWTPCAITCSAQEGAGIAELWSSILKYAERTRANGWFDQMRREQARHSIREALEQEIIQRLRFDPFLKERLTDLEQRVVSGQMRTTCAVAELMQLLATRVRENRSA